jgi:hypothetical protein
MDFKILKFLHCLLIPLYSSYSGIKPVVRNVFFTKPLKSVRLHHHRNVFVGHRKNKGIPRLVSSSELVLHIGPSVPSSVISHHLNPKQERVNEDDMKTK